MKDNEQIGSITRRLDAILRLMLESQKERNESLTIGDQILVLQDAGLSPSEAGKALGIASTQLTKYIKVAKNQKLRKKLESRRNRR